MNSGEFIPREHGAWAMWIVPMISAVLVSRLTPGVATLFLSFGLMYVAHHPIVATIRRKRRADGFWLALILCLASVSLGLVLVTLLRLEWLYVFGLIELFFFMANVRAFVDRDQRSFANELLVVAALTLSGPAAYYSATGSIGAKMIVIYILNFSFFGSSVFYVKTRIEFVRAKGVWLKAAGKARAMLILYHILLLAMLSLLAACGTVRIAILLSFIPMMLQVIVGIRSKKLKINFQKLGFALLAQSLLFLIGIDLFCR